MQNRLLLVLFFIYVNSFFAQNRVKVDSLYKLSITTTDDTLKVVALNKIAKEYWISKPDSSIFFLNKSFPIAEKLSNKKFLVGTYLYRAYAFSITSKRDSAILDYEMAVKLGEQYDVPKGQGQALSGLGNIYNVIGDYDKAIKYYMLALKVQDKGIDDSGLSKTYNSLGVLFEYQGNFKKALEYHSKALKIKEKLNDKVSMVNTLNNIGVVYGQLKEYEKALEYHNKAFNLASEVGDIIGNGMISSNMGNWYSKMGDMKKAIEYQKKAVAYYTKANYATGIARSNFNLGAAYFKNKEYDLGVNYIIKIVGLADELELKDLQKDIYEQLHDYYSIKNDYKKAYEYSLKYIAINDSIYNESKSKEINEINTRYETEKKEKEIEILNQKNEIQNLDLKQQQLYIYFVVVGLFLLVFIAIMLINRNRIKQRAFEIVSNQKEEITNQKNIIEEHQKEIIDSITYAKRLQSAILPTEKYIQSNLTKLNSK